MELAFILKSLLPTKCDWLIRVRHGTAYVWQRKFLLGFIPIPWALHGGTRTIFTPDVQGDVVIRATEYIGTKCERVKLKVIWETNK